MYYLIILMEKSGSSPGQEELRLSRMHLWLDGLILYDQLLCWCLTVTC